MFLHENDTCTHFIPKFKFHIEREVKIKWFTLKEGCGMKL